MDKAFDRVMGGNGGKAVPLDFPDHLLRELTEGWVTRQRMLTILDIDGGVRAQISSQARRMVPPHVVERRKKGVPFEVSFHLRPAAASENPGALFDVIAE
jgi:hypothetical protein